VLFGITRSAFDEYAFTGTRDVEIQASIRRGGLTFGSRRLLLKATTPWAKTGLAWQDMQRLGTNEPHAVTWHASTALMKRLASPRGCARVGAPETFVEGDVAA
jgi:hypothetical protein